MKTKIIAVFLFVILAFPMLAQIPGLPPGIPGLGLGTPVVDVTAILKLISQIEHQITQEGLSAAQIAKLVLVILRLESQLAQMYYNAKVMTNLRLYHPPWSLWYLVSMANVYGYNHGWMSAANGQTPGNVGYGGSVTPMPNYGGSLGGLSPQTAQRVQYQYDQAGLADGVATTTLTTTGAIRQNMGQTEAALQNLRDTTMDPTASEVQVLQKISTATYLQSRLQNDTNKLAAANAETAAYAAKVHRDEIQAAATDYQVMLNSYGDVQASTANASNAFLAYRQ